ncbi:MAG TPA: hypothetical protein VGN12_09050 [Pirellulales bacterium]|jgi:hypothetical protein
MSYPHVIRLRCPWECRPLVRYTIAPDGAIVAQSDDLPAPARVNVPADWEATLGAGFRGRVRYTRRFNRPTNLDPHDRVWLVIEGADALARYLLDETLLGELDGYALPAESDITPLLKPSNVLTVEVELPAGIDDARQVIRPGRESLAGGLVGAVRLEIRKHVHIAGLSLHWETGGKTPRLHIAGRVDGEASAARLAIAVNACERELAYQDISAGESFAINIPINDWPAWPDPMDEPVLTPVEIRLTDGRATLWQTTIETAPPQPDDQPTRAAMLRTISNEKPLAWLDYVDQASPTFQQVLSRPGTVVGLRAILPDALYQALDQANVGIVQQVPRAWSDRVCPRLAHHPAILAWEITPGNSPAIKNVHSPAEAAAIEQPTATRTLFGRPVIRIADKK